MQQLIFHNRTRNVSIIKSKQDQLWFQVGFDCENLQENKCRCFISLESIHFVIKIAKIVVRVLHRKNINFMPVSITERLIIGPMSTSFLVVLIEGHVESLPVVCLLGQSFWEPAGDYVCVTGPFEVSLALKVLWGQWR